MKKAILSLLVVVLGLVGSYGFAEELEDKTKEELIEIITALQEENAQYRKELGLEDDTQSEEGAAEPETTQAASYVELAQGSKGDEVKSLQSRLIELGYLDGGADGVYGKGTAGAVSAFQAQNGLTATGTADAATQELLFSADAARALVYEELDYVGVSRDPDDYEGRLVKFSGKVLQVIEDETIVSFRIATKGNYDNVVFVSMVIPEEYSRILEDDKVEVQGSYAGLLSYETVRGDTVTIPNIYASLITLK